jgi:hypothetical protein
MTAARESDIEDAVRKVLGEVLNEVSEELSAPEEPPTGGRPSRPPAGRMSARGAGGSRPTPPTPTPPNGGAEVPPAVADAMETVMREVTPDQAQALVTLFEAISDQDEEEEEPESAGAGFGAQELGSMSQAKAQGNAIAAAGVGRILALIVKNRRMLLAAGKAALRGPKALRAWANSLSNFSPIKWAIRVMNAATLADLVHQLVAAYREATSGRAMGARAMDAESADIEDVVRRVLSNALSDPYAGAPAH